MTSLLSFLTTRTPTAKRGLLPHAWKYEKVRARGERRTSCNLQAGAKRRRATDAVALFGPRALSITTANLGLSLARQGAPPRKPPPCSRNHLFRPRGASEMVARRLRGRVAVQALASAPQCGYQVLVLCLSPCPLRRTRLNVRTLTRAQWKLTR